MNKKITRIYRKIVLWYYFQRMKVIGIHFSKSKKKEWYKHVSGDSMEDLFNDFMKLS